MPELIYCSGCNKPLRVPEELIGRQVKCPECGYLFLALIGGSQAQAQDAQWVEAGEPGSRRAAGRPSYSDYASDGTVEPHRGVLILVLGILSLAIGCIGLPMGIAAWRMGKADQEKMQRGRMDPEGRSLTQAGYVCGMIGTILQGIAVAFFFIYMVVVVGVVAGR